MKPFMRILAVGLAVAAGPVLGGCFPVGGGKEWVVGGGSVSRSENGVTTSYTVGRLSCNNRVYFVLAANGCHGSRSGGGSGNAQGQLRVRDGRVLTWSCSTEDGKSGKVAIDGQEFDLTQGALFLVSTKDKPTRVEQLMVDVGQLQAGSATDPLSELAAADARIAAFLQSCKDNE